MKPAEFVRHQQGFQLHALVGANVPIGDYESDRALNLGHAINRSWSLFLGYGEIIAKNDDSEGQMLRFRLIWVF